MLFFIDLFFIDFFSFTSYSSFLLLLLFHCHHYCYINKIGMSELCARKFDPFCSFTHFFVILRTVLSHFGNLYFTQFSYVSEAFLAREAKKLEFCL